MGSARCYGGVYTGLETGPHRLGIAQFQRGEGGFAAPLQRTKVEGTGTTAQAASGPSERAVCNVLFVFCVCDVMFCVCTFSL